VVEFEWDEAKALSNLTKHQVDFTEAQSVFSDPLALITDDEDHSEQENREIIIGHSNQNRCLVISYTDRTGKVRIISARQATRRERQNYEKNI
jgi:uncharacterized DUF497 family protein